jgi:hypothetical protein
MQMLTSRDWRAVPSRFGCIGTSPLDGFLINASIPGIIFGHLASGLCLLLQQRQVKTAGRLVIFVGRFAGGLQFLHAISHHNQHVPTLGQIDFVPQRAMPWHDLGVVVGQGQNFVGGDNHPVDFSAGAGVLKGVKIGGAYNKTYFNLEDRRIFFNGGGTEYWAFGGMGQWRNLEWGAVFAKETNGDLAFVPDPLGGSVPIAVGYSANGVELFSRLRFGNAAVIAGFDDYIPHNLSPLINPNFKTRYAILGAEYHFSPSGYIFFETRLGDTTNAAGQGGFDAAAIGFRYDFSWKTPHVNDNSCFSEDVTGI